MVLAGGPNSTASPAHARPVFWNDFSDIRELKSFPKRMLTTINKASKKAEDEPSRPDVDSKLKDIEEGGQGQERAPDQGQGSLQKDKSRAE